jgi:3-phosphoshikimate 1-carboxyvinyltransferase
MKIEPAAAIEGAVAVPGVKGISQRAVLLGAVAEGQSVIRGFGRAADTETAISVARQIGADVEGDQEIHVLGLGLRGLREPDAPLDCGNAGTVLRLVCGLLAGQRGRFELVGDESLSARPHERVAEPLRLMGVRVETTDGHAPVVVEGGELNPIRYELPVPSAQVKSAILFAGLYARGGPTSVVERYPSRDHTERMLRGLGVRMGQTGHEATVWPVETLPPLDITIPGDFSSAAPLIVAATLLSGSELIVEGVNINPLRTGLLDVLERMGANIAVFNRRSQSGEPVADLEVRSSGLVATKIEREEVPRMIDELPLVALAAGMARGRTEVHGAEELRAKETDRIEQTVTALKSVGVRIEARPDGFVVRGTPARPRGGSIDAAGDHRLAMLGAVAGLVSLDGVSVEGADAVAISFPGFFDLLDSVTRR